MLIESDFFVGEHLRWNLGWASPNYAGAFVAALLALAFGFSRSRWCGYGFVLELGGFFLLAKTYSRGALVAWGVAWLFGVISAGGLLKSRERCLWLGRVAALGVILYSVGFQWSRAETIPTEGIQTDHSVGNRLELWKGGLRMIAAASLRGWGAGESGRAYQHWFQAIEREERFTTMVNSYLTVAVEYGLPIFALCLVMLCVPVLCAWQLARMGNYWGMAAGASLVSWLVANGFSTLWIEWRLWIVPAISYILLIHAFFQKRLMPLKPILLTGALVLVITTALYAVGATSSKEESLTISPKREGIVMTSKSTALTKRHVWPDSAVLGEFFGKELRRWLIEKKPSLRLVVHVAVGEATAVLPSSAKEVMLFGKQAARVGLGLPENCEMLYIIHPTVSPPNGVATLPQCIIVRFPEIDEIGNRLAWERWAKAQGAEFIVSNGSAVDIRSVWPEILNEVEEGGLEQ